ncbi:MAG: protein kinase [Acidobacteriia bacterium]|nr:protein kinase [Terriglobia bacterium]
MQCPHCKADNPPNSVRCSSCGTIYPPSDVTITGTNVGVSEAWTAPVGTTLVNQLADRGPIPSGTVLAGRYEILQLLGQGGMGAVYKARDNELDRLVAVKLIRPEYSSHPEILRRFKQELILARAVTHRNVVRIFDLGQADGFKFITMEYVEGRDLRSALLEKGKFPPAEAVAVMLQVCQALDSAHTEGVVHRDLKPQNIMLDAQNRVYVMDFGIARSSELSGMTQTGMLMGTPEYMSPEQARGQHVDARSDLFALGIIFYELLTGKSPYQADTTMATLWKRTQERSRPPIELDSSIPKPLSDAVQKCLEIETKDRYQSAREIINDLEAWQSTGKTTGGRPMSVPAPAPVYWKWLAAAMAALLLAGAVAVRFKGPAKPAAVHAPVSVLVADFANHTGDPIFDDTLEPMFNFALEGASFVNAYNRGRAHKLALQLPKPSETLDEQSARLIAVSQGIGAIVTGSLSRRGDGYKLSVEALDGVSGNTIASADVSASNKDELLLAVPRLAAPIRKALGDSTPESVQLQAAGGAFTAASLEAVHEYSIAMKQQFAGNMGEALKSFSKTAELDPNFARAYAGQAAVAGNLGQLQDAEKYAKLAMAHVDRMTERERYRIRGMYYIRTENWQKCVEEYSELLKQFPADNIGQNNLAGCFGSLHDMPKAMEAARRAVQLAPRDLAARMNYSLFACYAGDFQSCESEGNEVQKLNPSYEQGYLVRVYAQLGQGRLPQAAQIYQELQKLGTSGASLAASGLANLALYEGRYRQARQILESAVAAEIAAKQPDRAADNFVMLAFTEFLRGEKRPAIAAAEKALANSQSAKIRFLAARVFLETGETAKARELSAKLASELQAEPQAYAKLILGEIALKSRDPRQALQSFTEAKNLVDFWLVHVDLGRAYLDADAFAEADSEFDLCFKRRGEALELFTDNMPTYSYLPPLYYYQGRVREGLKSSGAADSYKTYLSIRGQAGEDPLLPEIRHRLGQ